MRTHFAPFTDLEDLEQAPCGSLLGEASELSGDWAKVDCLLCQKRKEQIIASAAAEERAIVEQMGDMANFMNAASAEPINDLCADGAHEFVAFRSECVKCGEPYNVDPSVAGKQEKKS